MLSILALGLNASAQVKKTVVKSKTKIISKHSTPVLLKASVANGSKIYGTYCITCHQADGGGVPNMNAPLIKTSYVLGDKTRLIKVLLKGMQNVEIDGETYSNVMPSAAFLTDQQMADVLSYVRNSFGNKASGITAAEVKAVRAKK